MTRSITTLRKLLLAIILIAFFIGCDSENISTNSKKGTSPPSPMFSKIDADHSNIHFKNTVKENRKFNFLSYMYVYLGGGVSTGDINNDGLIDIYFTSNQNSNKLYLNKGNFVFEDITRTSKTSDAEGWTTGTTMVDINNDGWLDIYVCESASLENDSHRKNKLFINQKDNTFKEEGAKWNLDHNGFSIQSYFFDMDKDGDLDMYLVNHRVDFRNNGQLNLALQRQIISETSDQLFRNDNGSFTNITQYAGLLNKAWGLSASIGDFNNDGWPDIYVCNDYLEPDKLYINNHDNTFSDQVLDKMNHISFNSMGSDYADINNDLLPDLTVLDMTPSDHVRSKTNMASMSTANFNSVVNAGYHHQYMVNVLQLNNGNSAFSEIGQMAHISKTDWSWAPLLADFDNDGFKDLYVTNGVYKDLGNRDFRNEIQSLTTQGKKVTLDSILTMIPSQKLANYMFKNNSDLTFSKMNSEWNLDLLSFSNGSSYADLDNDGDLDLVVNNIDDKAFIYKNNSTNNFIQLKLTGEQNNTMAIGTQAILYTKEDKQLQEMYTSRGFQSSVHNRINFGIGNQGQADSLIVTWPNGDVTKKFNVQANQTINLNIKESVKPEKLYSKKANHIVQKIVATELGIDFTHIENEFDDYKSQVLLPYSQSHNGPFMEKSDVNNDGLDDFFIGGASGQSGALFIQKSDLKFIKIDTPFDADKAYEDLGILFFDYDGDNDQDLYIVSGGSEFPEGSSMFQDRLYQNNGTGVFTKTKNVLPKIKQSGQVVIHEDIDNDGDEDLFIGGRLIPDKYPFAPKSYFLINTKGKFTLKEMKDENIGMVSDAVFTDYDNDGDKDLMLVGEWSEIMMLQNSEGEFSNAGIESFAESRGLWFSITANDIDQDGDDDYFIGNLGKNTKFATDKAKEFHIFCDDFDANGSYDILLSNKYKGDLVPMRGRECSSQQIPEIKEKFPDYNLFANATMNEIFGNDNLENALHYQVNTLNSKYVENLGNGRFKLSNLPMKNQLAPICKFAFFDFNKDGQLEIISAGNLFNTEVETVRFDASRGSIMKFDYGSIDIIDNMRTGFSTSNDSRDIIILNDKVILVSNNNGSIEAFKIL